MKRLLEFLWSGCWHEWETESITKIFSSADKTEDILSGKEIPIDKKYVLRCKKCGELKTYQLLKYPVVRIKLKIF